MVLRSLENLENLENLEKSGISVKKKRPKFFFIHNSLYFDSCILQLFLSLTCGSHIHISHHYHSISSIIISVT